MKRERDLRRKSKKDTLSAARTVATNKRKKIADATYRAGLSNSSDKESVVPPRKRSKKRGVANDQGLSICSSLKVEHNLPLEGAMHEDHEYQDENGAQGFVWERDSCRVM
jgi:hypothetical protein